MRRLPSDRSWRRSTTHAAARSSAEGELGDRLYVILSGKVKLGRHSPDGRENLLAVMGPSDMFGELSVFDPGPRTSTATAVTDVRLATMDRDALREWINKRPEIAEQLLRVLARRLRRTNNALADLIFTDVPGRVAKALLQLARQFGQQEGGHLRVTHDLTQEELAQLVGASRETVNKALADFGHRGLAAAGGQERRAARRRAAGPAARADPRRAVCSRDSQSWDRQSRPSTGSSAANTLSADRQRDDGRLRQCGDGFGESVRCQVPGARAHPDQGVDVGPAQRHELAARRPVPTSRSRPANESASRSGLAGIDRQQPQSARGSPPGGPVPG